MKLAGKTAIVTGASSGIGAAVARDLAAAGARIVATGRREARLTALVAELAPAEAVAVPADITAKETPDLLLSTATERFGRCDIVINGAGSMQAGPIESLDLEATAAMIRANLEAATRMAYAALRHFRAHGSGRLINLSSVLGTKVRPNAGAYAATKHGIEALSEALRMEVAGSAIGVSVVQPGLVETELQDHLAQHPRELLGIRQPLAAADVARCVRFILEQPEHVRIPVLMVLPAEHAV